MIEEIIEYHNLKKIEHQLICPTCRIALQISNTVLATYPAQYSYYCPKCEYSVTNTRIYPYVEIIGDPICTYSQEVK